MKKDYEAWETENGAAFFESTRLPENQANPAMKLVRRLFSVEAHTFEEALEVYSLRMGFGPHRPGGDPEPCPKCEAWFYPQGSGECWRCGKIC